MDKRNEFKRLLNFFDFNFDYEFLEDEFIELNKLAAKIAGTEISQLNLIDNLTQWSISQIGTKDLQTPKEDTICKYTVDESKPLEVLDLSKDDRFKNIESVREAGAKYYFGIPIISKEGFCIGSFCVISLNKLQLSKEKKELLIIIAKEITKRLETMREMNKLRKENSDLIDSSREISHDLRGMINGIAGMGDLIGMENEGRNKEIEKYVKLQKNSSASMLKYIETILDEKSNSDIKLTDKTTIKELSKKIERLYLPLAIKKGIKFENHFEEIDSEKKFESKMILQIIGNLISNAMKFTPINGLVRTEFKLTEKDINSFYLEILVIDSGIGMNKQKKKSILSKEKITSKGTGGEEGYGLGISLVQHHIKELKGQLLLDSEPGKGSTFKVIIPVK